MRQGDDVPITVDTHSTIHAVVKLWRRYVPLREEAYDRFLYLRAMACDSTAALGDPSFVLTVGRPISGLIEAAHGDHLAALLSGCAPISAAEWKLRSPRTLPDDGVELGGVAISYIPALAETNFANYHLPNLPYNRAYGPKVSKYCEPRANDPAAAKAHSAGRSRGRSSTPKNPPERRARGRFTPYRLPRRMGGAMLIRRLRARINRCGRMLIRHSLSPYLFHFFL